MQKEEEYDYKNSKQVMEALLHGETLEYGSERFKLMSDGTVKKTTAGCRPTWVETSIILENADRYKEIEELSQLAAYLKVLKAPAFELEMSANNNFPENSTYHHNGTMWLDGFDTPASIIDDEHEILVWYVRKRVAK